MRSKERETKAEKVIKMLGEKYCITLVKRIVCIILAAFEIEKRVISEELKLSLKSIKKYEKMLNNGLPAELMTIKCSSKQSEPEDYRDEIFAEPEAGEYKTLRQIKAMILAKTGLDRSRNSINVFLKKTDIAQSKQDLYLQRQTLSSSALSAKTY
jgi:hypothetical protein